MTVSTIASLTAGVTRALGTNNSKIASSVRDILSASSANSSSNESDPLSIVASLQSQVASLKIASRNITQASSLVNVAQTGASQINDALKKLQDIATRASDSTVTADERSQLDAQFKTTQQQITRIVESTRFNGQALLDGSANPLSNSSGGDNAVGGFTQRDLFGSANVNLQSAASAQQASKAVANAQAYVAAQSSNLDALATGIDNASASVLSALQNQDASRSTLSENDLVTALIKNSTPNLLATYSQQSLRAQTNRLPPSLVQLLSS